MFDIIYGTTAATRPGRTGTIDKVVIVVPVQTLYLTQCNSDGGANLNIKDKISND